MQSRVWAGFGRVSPAALRVGRGRAAEAPAGIDPTSTVAGGEYNQRVAQTIEELSFELTANALTQQERAVSGLRARAGTVLAAASIAGSFLGAKISGGSLEVWGIAAMISFASCMGSAIWVSLPHRFVFAFPGETLLAMHAHGRIGGVTDAYGVVGAWAKPYLQANHNKIAWLSSWLTVSCVLLAAEIALWTISLAG